MDSLNHVLSCLPKIEVDEYDWDNGINIVDFMVKYKIAKSRSDAKRKIRSGCVSTITIGVK